MIRRLFKTGNSIVLSLPKEALEVLNLSDGEKISLEVDREHQRIIISPVEKPVSMAGISEEFLHQVNEFIDQYRPALEELAK
jgi:putative addiction module antidote